jgi:hypothetical protein
MKHSTSPCSCTKHEATVTGAACGDGHCCTCIHVFGKEYRALLARNAGQHQLNDMHTKREAAALPASDSQLGIPGWGCIQLGISGCGCIRQPDYSSLATYLSAACCKGSREALAYKLIAGACDVESGRTHEGGARWCSFNVGTPGICGKAGRLCIQQQHNDIGSSVSTNSLVSDFICSDMQLVNV